MLAVIECDVAIIIVVQHFCMPVVVNAIVHIAADDNAVGAD